MRPSRGSPLKRRSLPELTRHDPVLPETNKPRTRNGLIDDSRLPPRISRENWRTSTFLATLPPDRISRAPIPEGLPTSMLTEWTVRSLTPTTSFPTDALSKARGERLEIFPATSLGASAETTASFRTCRNPCHAQASSSCASEGGRTIGKQPRFTKQPVSHDPDRLHVLGQTVPRCMEARTVPRPRSYPSIPSRISLLIGHAPTSARPENGEPAS